MSPEYQRAMGGSHAGADVATAAPLATQDLVAGQIDLQIEPASNFFAQAKAGAIKPYAITSKARSAAAGRGSRQTVCLHHSAGSGSAGRR